MVHRSFFRSDLRYPRLHHVCSYMYICYNVCTPDCLAMNVSEWVMVMCGTRVSTMRECRPTTRRLANGRNLSNRWWTDREHDETLDIYIE